MTTREAAYAALFAAVSGAWSWASMPSRRIKLWTDVPASQRPALYQFEGGAEKVEWTANNAVQRTTLFAKLFVYFNASDPGLPGATQMNNFMDAFQAALAPTGADLATGRNTLGGLVYLARIDGEVLRYPGDLDGDGMLVCPIKIVLP